MKRLIWKELYEQRYVPFAYAALLTSILIVWFVMGNYVATHGGQATDRLTPNTATDLLWVGIAWSGLLVCSSTISSEVGSGTLSFLSVLPVGRVRIWWTKITAGLLTSWFSILLMLVSYALCVVCVFGHAGFKEVNAVIHFHNSSVGQWLDLVTIYAVIIAVSILASTLTDRPAAAVGISLMGGICANLFISGDLITHLSDIETSGWMGLIYGYVAVALLASSLLVFRNGSTLKTARRFIVAGISLTVAAFIPVAIILTLGYLVKLALLQMPQVVDWTETHAIPNISSSKVVFRYVEVQYGRVRPGVVCHGTFQVGTSIKGVYPMSIKTYSPNISATLVTRQQQRKDGLRYFTYGLSYIYKPTLPVGNEVRQIDLIASNGKVVATIDIKAHKAIGLFVPLKWTPHLDEDGFYETDGQ